jgi:hypothetical protein
MLLLFACVCVCVCVCVCDTQVMSDVGVFIACRGQELAQNTDEKKKRSVDALAQKALAKKPGPGVWLLLFLHRHLLCRRVTKCLDYVYYQTIR